MNQPPFFGVEANQFLKISMHEDNATPLSPKPYSVFLLTSSYAAGAIAIPTGWIPWFIYLTPFHLCLSFALLLWNHHPAGQRGLWIYAALAFLAGFSAEVLGVATGFPFGDYVYGPVFGLQCWKVPLLIGVNWAMQVYLGNAVVNRLLPVSMSAWLRVALGALAPVAVDWLIEPVAIRYNMWQWAAGEPPLQNYIGWYGVSLLLSGFYHYCIGPSARNPVATLLMLLQIAFFLVLQI